MENQNTKILKELETNSEMSLIQGEKMVKAVDGLEPVMEGILMKTNELVEETKKNNDSKKSIEIEINGAETTYYKGEKGDKGDKGEFTDEDVARVTELVRAQVSDGKDGRDGIDGKDGETPVRGVDYFTDEDIANFIQEVVPFFPKGEQGERGEDGADAEVDYDSIVSAVIEKMPKAQEFKTDTPEELKQKLESLEVGLDYDTLSNTPNIEQMVRSVASKTISLQEIDNVDLSGVTITNGKYVLGSGGSGGAVDSVFGRTGTVVAALNDYTTALVPDSTNARYVTDAQLVVIGNTSGTNTGNQTSIVGITGTTAQFNTALTDGDFATLAGSETFTNKTLTSPILNAATIGTSLVPTTNDGAALGSTANSFSDLFLATGATLNIANGNWVATHSSGILTVSTGDLRVTTAGTASTSVVTLNGTQTLLNKRLTAPQVAAMQYTGEIFNFLAPTEELLTLNGVSTAVNEFTISNAATGTNPILEATGANTNIGITLKPKGTGTVSLTGSLALGTNSITMTGSIGVTGTRVTKGWFTNVESTNMPTVGGTAILTSLTAPQFTTIELGHATDTTLSRSTAGVLAVEGVVIPSISSTNTLTNKRITKRVLALSAGSATPAINTDSYDVVHITAQSAAITSFTSSLTGTPVDGDTLRISITDDGTARALTWGASFEASTVALPTTTVISTRLDVGFFWNTETTKWRCVAVA